MTVILSHHTALWIAVLLKSQHRASILAPVPGPVPLERMHVPNTVMSELLPSIAKLVHVEQESLCPLDVLVPEGSSRHFSDLIHPHAWTGPLPSSALLSLSPDVYVCTPSFAFLQLAATLDDISLMLLGHMLCGSCYPAHNDDGFVSLESLAEPAQLTSLLDESGGHRGVAKARKASHWVASGSRSMMESSLWLLLALPRDLGGFELRRGVLNQSVRLSPEARGIAHKGYCVADLSAPGTKTIYEYLGKAFHRSPERDIRRTLALEHDGYRVHELTIHQLVDPSQLYEVARTYAEATCTSLRPPTPGIRAKRRELVGRLIPRRQDIAPDGTILWEKPSWALPRGFL